VSRPSTPAEIKDAIKKYEKRVDDVVTAQFQVGMWWKLLGSRYVDQKMYGEALDAYQHAVEFFPTNQNLHYWVGLCAGTMAGTVHTNGAPPLPYGDVRATGDPRLAYLRTAESAYLRALELEGRYARPLYALGVLYTFELDEPDLAVPHLEKLLTIDKQHTQAQLVLARAYYMTGRFDDALALYDRVISQTKSPQWKEEAAANKKVILEETYGR
jgi:tetratricopeptide (TPR) repeat protein